jgi:hypothetical protein
MVVYSRTTMGTNPFVRRLSRGGQPTRFRRNRSRAG